jgi:hypothetical protein
LVLVEGLPGAGKTTTARLVEEWLRTRGHDARYFGELRTDHPVDFEAVALLSGADLERIRGEFPAQAEAVAQAAEPRDGYWLVRDRERAGWPEALRRELRARDAYDGDITPDLHRRALLDSWQRFADAAVDDPSVHVFECVFVQNPVCALMARFDRPPAEVKTHIGQLAATVAGLDPVLVYLDAGDPEAVLTAAAAERPPEWLDFVTRYHTDQGYGRARGLHGFAGLVEFMRMRREFELELLSRLPIKAHRLDVASRDRDVHHRELSAVLEDSVGRRA